MRPSVWLIVAAGVIICFLMGNFRSDQESKRPDITVAPVSLAREESPSQTGTFPIMADVNSDWETEDGGFTRAELSEIQQLIDNRSTWIDADEMGRGTFR